MITKDMVKMFFKLHKAEMTFTSVKNNLSAVLRLLRHQIKKWNSSKGQLWEVSIQLLSSQTPEQVEGREGAEPIEIQWYFWKH